MLRASAILIAVVAQTTSAEATSQPLDSAAFQAILLGVGVVVVRAFSDDIIKISHSIADFIPKRLESAQKGQSAKVEAYEALVEQNHKLFEQLELREQSIARRDEKLEQFTEVLLQTQEIIDAQRQQLDAANKEKQTMAENAELQDGAMKTLAERNRQLEETNRQSRLVIEELARRLAKYEPVDPALTTRFAGSPTPPLPVNPSGAESSAAALTNKE